MSMYSNPIYGSTQLQLAQSIIEARQSLATPIKQHFVEWFSGDALDSIWTLAQRQGSGGSGAMVDAIDEGFEINSGGASSQYVLWANGISHFSYQNSGFISVSRSSSASGWHNTGIGEAMATNPSTHWYVWQTDMATSFISIQSNNNTTATNTNSTIGVDQNWHTLKATISSTSIRGWIDGNFEVVKTNTLPTIDMTATPMQVGTGSSITMRCRYFEVMNL